MPHGDMLTGTPDTGFAPLLGGAIGFAMVGALLWGFTQVAPWLRKPPLPNVVALSSRAVAVPLMFLLFAAVLGAAMAVGPPPGDGGEGLAIVIACFLLVGPAGLFGLIAVLRWAIVVEQDGVVHRHILGSRRIAWADIRAVYVAGRGHIVFEVGPPGNLIAPADVLNRHILIPAARSAGVPDRPPPQWERDGEEDEEA